MKPVPSTTPAEQASLWQHRDADPAPALLNEAEAARYLRVSRGWLRKSRCGALPLETPVPPYIRIGRTIRYRMSDLLAFVEAHRVGQ